MLASTVIKVTQNASTIRYIVRSLNSPVGGRIYSELFTACDNPL